MNNYDEQVVVPFSPRESSSKIEEQTLEQITGAGLKSFFRACCTAPKTLSSPLASSGHMSTKTPRPVTYAQYANKPAVPEGSGPSTSHIRSFSIDDRKMAQLPPIRTK